VRKITYFSICLGFLLATPFLNAGICVSDPQTQDYHHEFQLFAGYSPHSSTLIGTAVKRQFVLAGFSYGYRCWAWRSVSVAYTAGVSPAAILLQPTEYLYNQPPSPDLLTPRFSPSHAVYGADVTPIGFTIDFARTRKLHPFFQTDGGIIASSEPIPANIPHATAVNFLFDFGGGGQWRLDEGHALRLGYKFLHISNAGRTTFNPGIDNNIFYVGFSFLK